MEPVMLFVTNRRLCEGPLSSPGRAVTFNLRDGEPSISVFFCRRAGPGAYEEITAAPFFRKLRGSGRRQVLFYLHGFNSLPETSIFPNAELLQMLADELVPGLVEVVPLIWPCQQGAGLVLDYFDDQTAAEASGLAFARMLAKFTAWRDTLDDEAACLKHVNILAHSMGNRTLRFALQKFAADHGTVPALFRSIFMAAADVANECLETGEAGEALPRAARNLVVYHAADDLALRSSKVANLKNKVVTRRLGHTGPEHLERTPANVSAVDCDAFNSLYDRLGHSYFLGDPGGRPGMALRHMVETMRTGRVAGLVQGQRRLVLAANDNDPAARVA
jgi:esterase/lipase superfamily enzyme